MHYFIIFYKINILCVHTYTRTYILGIFPIFVHEIYFILSRKRKNINDISIMNKYIRQSKKFVSRIMFNVYYVTQKV